MLHQTADVVIDLQLQNPGPDLLVQSQRFIDHQQEVPVPQRLPNLRQEPLLKLFQWSLSIGGLLWPWELDIPISV